MGAEHLLLNARPREVRERLLRHGKSVQLAHGEVLHRPSRTIDDVYFPLDCMISVTVTMEEGQTVEAGAVGRREMVGDCPGTDRGRRQRQRSTPRHHPWLSL